MTITVVEMPGLPAFGAGWFGVQARHGDVVGEYPIFMPMTTEQSVVGGRETYGEPKKIAEVWAHRDGDQVDARIARLGFTVCEIHGRITESREPYEKRKTDFWFKVSPSAEKPGGLDQDPLLVYGEKVEKARVHEGIDGELILKDSPLDPVADGRRARDADPRIRRRSHDHRRRDPVRVAEGESKKGRGLQHAARVRVHHRGGAGAARPRCRRVQVEPIRRRKAA